MEEQQRGEIRSQFDEVVNMTAEELERWLETEESQSVGESEHGESKGHQSGRRIVRILRSSRGELDEQDYEHMRKVIGYVHRHLAQPPSGDTRETRWRSSLKNWGHDPLK
ncbi:uncharacterized protein DUF3140 [Halopolyspora algeriensis]|uniref:Uncharacterized protein DUF3140 n=1 Tax=Halopolyspora algeriensis TaxID=1500506 RepID=A0A368VKZ6_9ACTN|nr:DUF3140 domain-containing protein [Halopolyspora algeriensis]RCW40984.1 uncharacterized protein DUF3140 [Halopolyspora algeriensis]TQM53932.1 uncharacterized protein DUF3140 [Halopolyspora algeriensis]